MSDFIVKEGFDLGASMKAAVGAVTGNATLDLSTGNDFSLTPTANVTFTFSNPPATGAYDFTLKLTGEFIDNPYDLANASYASVSFSVAAQDTAPQKVSFKSDGTKMYVLGFIGIDVNEYDLGTAWDISTASYVQNFSVSTDVVQPVGLSFKTDGTKMYIVDLSADDISEYSLSSAWNISTASYVQNFSVSAQEDQPLGVAFKSDGTKMYVVGSTGADVNEYSLTSAWDISTASYVQNFSVSTQDTAPRDLAFTPSGTKMYVLGTVGDDVNEYSLSSAWDISTASYVQNFSVSAQDSIPVGISFGDNGTKLYMIGQSTDAVYQYSTGTYGDATFTYPASVKWPAGTPPTAPADCETDVLTFFTTDGGTTYYGIRTGDDMS
jgi:hypothetical protein